MTDIVHRLTQLGPLPSSDTADEAELTVYEELLAQLTKPISDEDAKALITLFGPDDCFGLAWSLVHLIESSPGWPLMECLNDPKNEWIARLRETALRGPSNSRQ